MKKTLVFFSLISFNLNASSMRPLSEYMKQHNIDTDKQASGYVFLRCTCMLKILSVFMDSGEKKNEEDMKISKYFDDKSKLFLAGVISTLNMNAEELVKKLEEMNKLYNSDMDKNYVRTGEFILGSYLEDDMNICKNMAKKTDKIKNEK